MRFRVFNLKRTLHAYKLSLRAYGSAHQDRSLEDTILGSLDGDLVQDSEWLRRKVER